MNKYGKVAVLMGGDSTEREVSFLSGKAVLNSLIKSGVNAFAFDPLEEPLEKLKEYNCDRAFNLIHGKNGEDGKLQGALEYLKIPYTGSGVTASAIGMDKYRTKLIWKSLNIPVAESVYLEKDSYNKEDYKLTIALPVIVKPADDGSSLGFSRVTKIEDLYAAIDKAFAKTNKILIEKMIIGSEYTITIFDGKVYPIIKIEAPDGDYDFEHKYYSDETKYLAGYDLGELHKSIEKWALDGYNAIGASGVARSDFMISNDGQVYFLEINTLPGMTGHSLVPQSLASVGINFDDLCLKILDGTSLVK